MSRVLLFCLVVCVIVAFPACAKKVPMRSPAVLQALGQSSSQSDDWRSSVIFAPEAQDIAAAPDMTGLTVTGISSGRAVGVSLDVDGRTLQQNTQSGSQVGTQSGTPKGRDAGWEAGRAALTKAAMAAALSVGSVAWQGGDDTRPARAKISIGFEKSQVRFLLARVTVRPASTEKAKNADASVFSYPGKEWLEVHVVSHLPTETDAAYLRLLEKRCSIFTDEPSAWHIEEQTLQGYVNALTPERDAELSAALGVAPGTVDLSRFILPPEMKHFD